MGHSDNASGGGQGGAQLTAWAWATVEGDPWFKYLKTPGSHLIDLKRPRLGCSPVTNSLPSPHHPLLSTPCRPPPAAPPRSCANDQRSHQLLMPNQYMQARAKADALSPCVGEGEAAMVTHLLFSLRTILVNPFAYKTLPRRFATLEPARATTWP